MSQNRAAMNAGLPGSGTSDHAVLLEAIRGLPVAVIVAEAPTGRLVAANHMVEEIWRLPVRASEGVADYVNWQGFHLDGRPMQASDWPLARAVMLGEDVHGEDVAILRGDGTYALISVSAAPIRDESGGIVAGVASFFEVTRERQRTRNIEFLSRTADLVVPPVAAESTLQGIMRAAVMGFADIAFVYLFDDGRLQRNEVSAADPARERFVRDMWRRFPPQVEPLLQVVRKGTPLLTADVDDRTWEWVPDPEHRAALERLGIVSAINIPVQSDDRHYGVISLASCRRWLHYNEHDLRAASEAAKRLGMALQASRLIELEAQQRHRVELLRDLSAKLVPLARVNDVSRETLQWAMRVVDSSAGALYIVDEPGEVLELECAIGSSQEDQERHRVIPLSSSLPVVRTAISGETYVLTNREEARHLTPGQPDLWPGPATRGWIFLPMKGRRARLGAVVIRVTDGEAVDRDQFDLLRTIVDQCALALERARAFEAEEKAREEAERANRLKDEFLTVVSHELRTPMTTIIGWAELLLMGELPEETRSGIENLLRSAHLQANLIEELLDLSRVTSGRMHIEREQIDLAATARLAFDSVAIGARHRNLDFQFVASEPVPIQADPLRIRQIVTNLVENAVKFTPDGGRISVRVQRHGDRAQLAVIDTGSGIAPSFASRLFTPFQQASSGTSRSYMGMGIGLSIVKHLVELHGGTVRAESEGVGLGATFTVELPG